MPPINESAKTTNTKLGLLLVGAFMATVSAADDKWDFTYCRPWEPDCHNKKATTESPVQEAAIPSETTLQVDTAKGLLKAGKTWIYTAEEDDYRIRIVFTQKRFPKRQRKCFFQVYDGQDVNDKLRKMLCGEDIRLNQPYFTSGRSLSLYVSSSMKFGFAANLTAMRKGDPPCRWYDETSTQESLHASMDVFLDRNSTYLESPNFGGNGFYPPHINCTWNISAPVNKSIELRLISDAMLTNDDDRLLLKEQLNDIEVTSLTKSGDSYESKSNGLQVEFSSNYFGQEKGFYAQLKLANSD